MAPQNPPSTCLFLPELPPDLTDAILERHFRGFVGYDSCRTRHDRNGKLVGFVEFETIDDAVRCRENQQGQSPFPGVNWHIHFSNSQGRPSSGATASGGKRPRDESGPPVPRQDALRHSSDGRSPMVMPPPAGYPREVRGEPGGYAPSPQGPSPYGPPPGGSGGGGGGGYPAAAYNHHPPAHADPMSMQPTLPNYLGLQLPFDASSTLYIEGLPPDATEREVAHVFRRYEGQGFQSIRMKGIESSKNPGANLVLCFVEFDNAHQATIAMYGLQGYRFDVSKPDGAPMKISYAKSKGSRDSRGPPPARVSSAPSHGGAGGGGGGYVDRRDSSRDIDRYDDRYSERTHLRGGYEADDRGHSYNDEDDGRHHSHRRGFDDDRRDDYEDSERGEDDVFQRADGVTMQGVTDT